MEICTGKWTNSHDEIVWDGRGPCPLCEAMKVIELLRNEVKQLIDKEE